MNCCYILCMPGPHFQKSKKSILYKTYTLCKVEQQKQVLSKTTPTNHHSSFYLPPAAAAAAEAAAMSDSKHSDSGIHSSNHHHSSCRILHCYFPTHREQRSQSWSCCCWRVRCHCRIRRGGRRDCCFVECWCRQLVTPCGRGFRLALRDRTCRLEAPFGLMRAQSRQSRCLASSRRWLGIQREVLHLILLRRRLLRPMGSRARFEVVPYLILVSAFCKSKGGHTR